MALAISFPKKRNFILILAMCAGLVVLPKGTVNSPLVLNMYFVPSWLPVGAEIHIWSTFLHVPSHIYHISIENVKILIMGSWVMSSVLCIFDCLEMLSMSDPDPVWNKLYLSVLVLHKKPTWKAFYLNACASGFIMEGDRLIVWLICRFWVFISFIGINGRRLW